MTGPAITADNLPAGFAALAAGLRFPDGYRASGGDPALWQARGLALARGLILPDWPAVPVTAETLAVEHRGDHDFHHLALTLAHGCRAEAFLLMPHGDGPHPAVLALHDHGSQFAIGKEKCIPLGPGGQSEEWAARFYGGQAIGSALVRRGYAVLSVDALGWGGRQGQGHDGQQALAANLMNLGLTLAGLVAHEDMCAAEWLAGLPQVDAGRIAAVGFSMGAFRAWQLAALSPHVAAAVASGWMVSLPGLMVPGNNHLRGQSAYYLTHPLLARHMDLPDLAALAAPKPLLVQTGAQDHLFPADAVALAYAKLREVWAAWGADARLETQMWPGGHVFPPERQDPAFDWLDRMLR